MEGVKLRMHNAIARLALQYSSESWELRKDVSAITVMQYISLSDKTRSTDIRKRLGTKNDGRYIRCSNANGITMQKGCFLNPFSAKRVFSSAYWKTGHWTSR
jgi:hypothetical protein